MPIVAQCWHIMTTRFHSSPKDAWVKFRLNEQDRATLERVACLEQDSYSAVLRRAIRIYSKHHAKPLPPLPGDEP